jgi:glyoxylase-like metal-dependent hydrolase (beta-lactamase superfamily II)
MKTLTIGNVSIGNVIEVGPLEVDHTYLLLGSTPEALVRHKEWLMPHFMTAAHKLLMSIHTYIVKTKRHTILVDMCFGNNKQRGPKSTATNMNTPYLENLARAGAPADTVDYVLCTHLHNDHVGWNTKLVNGKWVPTFPKAKYLMSKQEYGYWSGRKEGDFSYDSFVDSVLPVVQAGQAMMVDSDFAIEDEVRLESAAGHTPGQVSLKVNSKKREAVLCGDLMHHPAQIGEPDWNIPYDVDPPGTRQARRDFFKKYADSGAFILPAHFASPTVGRIVSKGNGWAWKAYFGD